MFREPKFALVSRKSALPRRPLVAKAANERSRREKQRPKFQEGGRWFKQDVWLEKPEPCRASYRRGLCLHTSSTVT